MNRNPDKWIRKGIIQCLGSSAPIYDMRVTGNNYPDKYIILSTQTKQTTNATKCGSQWDCSILLDLVTRYTATSNPGDRVAVNDIEDDVIINMNNFSIENFSLFSIQIESSTSLDTLTDTMNVFRQLVRYRIILNEI